MATDVGCSECWTWARLLADKGFPTSNDTYCGRCGTREADVAAALRELSDREEYLAAKGDHQRQLRKDDPWLFLDE